MRLALIMLLLLGVSTGSGCTTVESTKLVTYETGSINLHPFPFPTREVTNEAGTVHYEMILPDGTYQTIEGMPNLGNLTLVTNQNDGTEATTDTRTDAEIDANIEGLK